MEKKLTFQLHEGEVYIPLIQLLKAMNVAESGGDAQRMVMEARVLLNDAIELRKRAKVRAGDVVKVADVEIQIF
jgi:ribosome-associated protein